MKVKKKKRRKRENILTEQEYHRLIYVDCISNRLKIMSELNLVRINGTEKDIETFSSNIPHLNKTAWKKLPLLRENRNSTTSHIVMERKEALPPPQMLRIEDLT